MPSYYDPHVKPDPDAWLRLDEQERIAQALKYHKKSRIRLPSAEAHALFHAIVENQIAENEPAVVRAMERLSAQGLNRHDCIHAIAWVLTLHVTERMDADVPVDPEIANAKYAAAVERLNAKDWLDLDTQRLLD